jgi:hypothetical protein
MRSPTVIALVLAVASSGCYFLSPHGARRSPRPQIVDGATLDLQVEDGASWVTCTEREIERDSCHYRGGKWKRRQTYVDVTFSYDGKPLTRGEARALVDDKYDEKWRALESKRSTCRWSLVPSAIAMLGYIAIPIVLSDRAKQKFGEDNMTPFYVAAGVGIGGALASYPMGGYACRQARRIGNDLGVWTASQRRRRFYREDSSDVRASKELARIVEEFNGKMRVSRP